MAAPNLPVNIDSTDGAGLTAHDHQAHHDAVHTIVNNFDKDLTPTTGQAPVHNGTSYVPTDVATQSELDALTTADVPESTDRRYMTDTQEQKLDGIEPGADITDAANVAAAGAQMVSEKGVANGYASLGADSLVPQDQLGTGTQDGTKFLRDDGTWQTVATGGTDDQTATEVPFTPAGTIAATDVQAAIEELDTEKEAAGTVAAHESDTTNIHGISDTSQLIIEGDNRLTNTRTPTDGTVDTAKGAGAGIMGHMLHNGTNWTSNGTTTATRPSNTLFPAGFVTWACQSGNEPSVGDGSGFLAGDLVVTW